MTVISPTAGAAILKTAHASAILSENIVPAKKQRNQHLSDRRHGDRGNNSHQRHPDRSQSGRKCCSADDHTACRRNAARLRPSGHYAASIGIKLCVQQNEPCPPRLGRTRFVYALRFISGHCGYQPRSCPSGLMVTILTGISLPLSSTAVFTAKLSPPQQGTVMRATVTLRISQVLKISASFIA